MGLLLPHIFTVSLYPDMVTVSENRDGNHTGGGKRNEITGFSKGSRYRLFRLLHSLQFSEISFVTLTYGQSFPHDGRRAKFHLQTYRRTFEKRFGAVPAIWRMEFQQRGAPHFHLLYLDPPFIPVKDWNALWDNAAEIPVEERSGNSLDLKFNREAKGSDVIGKYIGKYIAKTPSSEEDDPPQKWGRIWGKWNIEEPEPEKIELSGYEASRLAALLLPDPNDGGWQPMSRDNFTVFGPSMGKDYFRQEVTGKMQLLFSYTRKYNQEYLRLKTG